MTVWLLGCGCFLAGWVCLCVGFTAGYVAGQRWLLKEHERLLAERRRLDVGDLPNINNSPLITWSGSVLWNVRDIIFGPNRKL